LLHFCSNHKVTIMNSKQATNSNSEYTDTHSDQPELEGLVNGIEDISPRVHDLNYRLYHLVSRLTGPEPKAESKGDADDAGGEGMLLRLKLEQSRVDRALNTTEQLIARLETLL